jgi:hypothetical protein
MLPHFANVEESAYDDGMSLLSRIFPPARPRRRVAAVFGGFSILGLVSITFMRAACGKAASMPCASTNDCARNLICAEGVDDATRGKKRPSGVNLCAKPCASDQDCTTGLTCELGFEHSLGPRGGKRRERAKACFGE